MEDFNSRRVYARYTTFSIGPEAEGFAIKVLTGYSGDAGDSLVYHAGSRFSTKDMDQDSWPEGSCAQSHGKYGICILIIQWNTVANVVCLWIHY